MLNLINIAVTKEIVSKGLFKICMILEYFCITMTSGFIPGSPVSVVYLVGDMECEGAV